MIPAWRSLAVSLLIVLLSVLVMQAAEAQKLAANCANVQILSDQLATRDAEAYCQYAVSERQKVEDFWGATWKEPIRIHVDRSYRISKALLPTNRGNRGFMEMPLRTVQNNNGALLHEIVHIYAPNDNRFLAEGLAVYLHQKLAGNPAFPDFGKSLDAEARARLREINSLDRLNDVRTPKPLSSVLSEESAYVLAGSFVGFLIEKFGLAEFRKFYETGTYETTYGKSLAELEKEWRFALG
jgi:hypothetical protein